MAIISQLLKEYWCQITLIIIGTIAMWWVQSLRVDLAKSQSETAQYKSALDYQNDTLLREGAEHEAKMKELPKEIEKVTTKYKIVYRDIETWRGDDNASDCDNALDFLNRFNY